MNPNNKKAPQREALKRLGGPDSKNLQEGSDVNKATPVLRHCHALQCATAETTGGAL